MQGFKDRFARNTQQMIETFKQEIEREYQNYIDNGPGADHVSLDQGLELLNHSKDSLTALNARKDDYVQSENLFGLTISKYPDLIKMEELNTIYSKIYGIYELHSEKVKEFSTINWSKLSPDALKAEADH
jgi:dynein heavy chain